MKYKYLNIKYKCLNIKYKNLNITYKLSNQKYKMLTPEPLHLRFITLDMVSSNAISVTFIDCIQNTKYKVSKYREQRDVYIHTFNSVTVL